ncbi:LAMI_0C07250g1_1 [Lachancea mirantina]|uniref:LAMI_0C07250g1_1 n=1 Tax=Lachancea mirantina TaxID=1230905 RepID=A0A1G4J3W4_9SACH|nr:LAMI_0C07250g1_1 [Lachancea mirantina]
MDQTRTQTNTPPAEAVGLHQETRKASLASGEPARMPSAQESGVCTAGAPAPANVSMHGVAAATVLGETRSSVHQTQPTLPALPAGATSASCGTVATSPESCGEPMFCTALERGSGELFKQFDAKTGQFLARPAADNSGSGSGSSSSGSEGFVESAEAPVMRAAIRAAPLPSPDPMAKGVYQTLASLKAAAVKNNKTRSHSVPSILHSSLRKIGISTSCGLMSPQREEDLPDHEQQQQEQTQEPGNQSAQQDEQQHVKQDTVHEPSDLQVQPQAQLPIHQQHLQHMTHHFNHGVKKKQRHRNASALRHALLTNQRLPIRDHTHLALEDRIKYIKLHPGPMPLPPINLQCLKEIDLQEIVKNPQLRHDIIFDPLLQFRPNLDGERGLKKRQVADKYWADVENEIHVYTTRPDVFDYNHTRLVPLFNSLKEVLTTIVPQKEVHAVQSVLDTELLVQELLRGSLKLSNFSEWLAQLFKHHCAPMRDPWVDKMNLKFKESEEEKSVCKLVDGLRLVFQILEAMKLDIANHQIRILRPALLSNAVEFEKQYFQSLMSSNRVNLKSSFKWFNDKFAEQSSSDKKTLLRAPELYRLCIRSIISLLSCRRMVREYPTSLSFDHARLILLRADIRQIVCLLVCKLLFKQLIANDVSMDKRTKDYVLNSYPGKKLKQEIVSIITDEHGNCRWTKNTMSIAIHLCKTIRDLKTQCILENTPNTGTSAQLTDTSPLNTAQIDFAKSWLSKQTQPLSEVYGVLENRVFKSLENSIFSRSGCTQDGTIKQDFIHLCSTTPSGASVTSSTPSTLAGNVNTTSKLASSNASFKDSPEQKLPSAPQTIGQTSPFMDVEEFESLFCHLYTLVNFHWSVFGCLYMDSLHDAVSGVN